MDENMENVTTEEESVVNSDVDEEVSENIDTDTSIDEESTDVIPYIDPNEPITQETIDKVGKLIREIGDSVKIMQEIWMETQRDYGVNRSQLNELSAFNNNHRVPKPDDLPADEEWDMYNGFDHLTYNDMERIFGSEHPIYGVDISQTIDRVKIVFRSFIDWMTALREYNNVHNGYAVLMDMYDEQNMNEFQKICDAETDPDKKRLQQANIDLYRSNKNLGFLKEPLDDKSVERLYTAFTNKSKCEYWMKRSVDKLRQLKISEKFLEEIWGFEKRFLDEKYHRLNNMMLVYFMNLIVFCKCTDGSATNIRRTHVMFMFAALDGYVQKRIDPSRKDKIKENVCAFLDMMLDKIPDGVDTINDEYGSK